MSSLRANMTTLDDDRISIMFYLYGEVRAFFIVSLQCIIKSLIKWDLLKAHHHKRQFSLSMLQLRHSNQTQSVSGTLNIKGLCFICVISLSELSHIASNKIKDYHYVFIQNYIVLYESYFTYTLEKMYTTDSQN